MTPDMPETRLLQNSASITRRSAALRTSGRATPRNDWKSARGVRARIEAEHARTAPMIERAAAMDVDIAWAHCRQ